jgi:molybdopterin/thiamine biosynthesis adenylyltransferase
MAAGVSLVESGTAGYLGQVQPLLKDVTECFDCVPKPTPRTFPVCTIRSTPSLPIHCIVWGKSYLFSYVLVSCKFRVIAEIEAVLGSCSEKTRMRRGSQSWMLR